MKEPNGVHKKDSAINAEDKKEYPVRGRRKRLLIDYNKLNNTGFDEDFENGEEKKKIKRKLIPKPPKELKKERINVQRTETVKRKKRKITADYKKDSERLVNKEPIINNGSENNMEISKSNEKEMRLVNKEPIINNGSKNNMEISKSNENEMEYYNNFVAFCKSCNKQFHKVPGSQPSICPDCNKKYLYECKKCKGIVKSYNLMIDHITKNCGSSGSLSCTMCDYRTDKKSLLDDHLEIQHEIKILKCSTVGCNQVVDTIHMLSLHERHCSKKKEIADAKKAENKKKYPRSRPGSKGNLPKTWYLHTEIQEYCSNCDKFTDKVPGIRNISCSDCQEKLKFRCKRCNAFRTTYERIANHVKYSCGMKNFTCDLCGHGVSKKYMLVDHMTVFHKDLYTEADKFFKCRITNCHKIFSTVLELRQHNVLHLGPKKKCSVPGCKFASNHVGSYNTHLRAVHGLGDAASRRRICETCGAVFKDLKTLNRHVKHHSEPDLQCAHCDYKSWEKIPSMERHMQRKHKEYYGKFEFCCKYCKVDFKDSTNLMRHNKYTYIDDDGKCTMKKERLKELKDQKEMKNSRRRLRRSLKKIEKASTFEKLFVPK